MAISCALGFAVCLSYKGSEIHEEDVFAILYYCDELQALPASSFLEDYSVPMRARLGYINADALEELGLEFSWKPSGEYTPAMLANYRRAELTRACREFNQIQSNPNNWDK